MRLKLNFKTYNMKKKYFSIQVLIMLLFTISLSKAEISNNFIDGKKLFEKKKYEESKIFFEKDIVFNPKSEKAYLYLAKIYNKEDNNDQEEANLNNVLLLNPQNDEAIYMMAILKIKQSDYEKTRELIKKFDLVCKSFCFKKKEIKKKFEKLIPKNAKGNN